MRHIDRRVSVAAGRVASVAFGRVRTSLRTPPPNAPSLRNVIRFGGSAPVPRRRLRSVLYSQQVSGQASMFFPSVHDRAMLARSGTFGDTSLDWMMRSIPLVIAPACLQIVGSGSYTQSPTTNSDDLPTVKDVSSSKRMTNVVFPSVANSSLELTGSPSRTTSGSAS